jgi:hypothetical protein
MSAPTDPITAGIATVIGAILAVLGSIDWSYLVFVAVLVGLWAVVEGAFFGPARRQRKEMIDQLREINRTLERVADRLERR